MTLERLLDALRVPGDEEPWQAVAVWFLRWLAALQAGVLVVVLVVRVVRGL